jgi:hypothetical protein
MAGSWELPQRLRGQEVAVGSESKEVGGKGGIVVRVHGEVEFKVKEELDLEHVEVRQLDAADLGPVMQSTGCQKNAEGRQIKVGTIGL